MKKWMFLAVMVLSGQASAAMITLDVSGAQDALNTPLTVSAILDVDELNGESVAVSTFNISLFFDESLFSFMAGSESTPLISPVFSQLVTVPAAANEVATTFFSDPEFVFTLDQTLFSIQLMALAPGVSDISVMVNQMAGGFFGSVPVQLSQNMATTQVTVAQSVPAPQTVALFAGALALLMSRRMRRG